MTAPRPRLEAVLFAAPKPILPARLASILGVSLDDVTREIAALRDRRNTEDSGIFLVESGEGVSLATNPALHETVRAFIGDDTETELTRPSLETLTIVAYRGPITKPEIEMIRGVNCTMILRNLLMRGLIVEGDDAQKMQPVYTLSTDAMSHLGIATLAELPSYADFHGNTKIDKLLASFRDDGSI